jgi:hypothetical protein
MLTDDDVATQLRGSMSGSVADLAPSPGLLSRVHQAHHKAVRRQRLLAPAGLAVLALAATGAVALYPEANKPVQSRLLSPSEVELVDPGINIGGYTFRFPRDFQIDPAFKALAPTKRPVPFAWAYRGKSMKEGDRIHVSVMERRKDSATVEQAERAYREMGVDAERLVIAGFSAVVRREGAVIAGGRTALRATVGVQVELPDDMQLQLSGTNVSEDIVLAIIEDALAQAPLSR